MRVCICFSWFYLEKNFRVKWGGGGCIEIKDGVK